MAAGGGAPPMAGGMTQPPPDELAGEEAAAEAPMEEPVSDEALEVPRPTGETWRPKNYDGVFHGKVTLYEALTQSYNLATARLGLELGLPQVLHTLNRLGIERELKPYPSLLLGAVELTPWEVTQLYPVILMEFLMKLG